MPKTMLGKKAMNTTTEPKPPKGGHYLYAITGQAKERTFDVLGLDGSTVYNVCNGQIAAVVSDCAHSRIRPERRHLAAHKEVLQRLMLDQTVLPMAFGIIADDLKAVRRLLSLSHQAFLDQLRRVEGKLEMGLRVVWDVPNIFEFFIDTHPELRAARDHLLGNNRVARQEDKIEVGQMFEHLLNEDREAHGAAIEEVLSPCCVEIKHSPPRGLNEVVNLNCLVDRQAQKRLEDAVFAAAKLFDNNFAFDLNGPWAPHNFVEMNLDPGTLNKD